MAHMLATYIALPGTTAEAMEHWQEVFGGDLEIIRYGEAQLKNLPFDPPANAVAHASLTLPAGVITGGDVMDQSNEYPVRGTAYSLLYTTDTPEEAQLYIDRLSAAGGSIGMPFEQAPWGDWYGQVFDRYGVMWAFSCAVA
ncbi:VOC family protein [Leucobacter sp. BZR 635]